MPLSANYVTDVNAQARALVAHSVAVLDGSSVPTLTLAQSFVIQREAELHSAMREAELTVIPIVDETYFALAQMMVAQIVAYDIWISAFIDETLPPQLQSYLDKWLEYLNKIRSKLLMTETPTETIDDFAFGIAPPIVRDDYYSNNWNRTDFDA